MQATLGTPSLPRPLPTARGFRVVPATAARWTVGLATAAAIALGTIYGLDSLTVDARVALAVFGLTLVGWVILDLPETPVALVGAVALVLAETVDRDTLFVTMGNEVVWLMIAAFVLAAVLRKSGATERAALAVLGRCRTVGSVFWAATLVIAATAFLIPSTSARAVILLPVFTALRDAIGRPRVAKGLALLFPSVILLSAAGSITGAGAHLVAADFMERFGGRHLGFLDWAMLALPFALLTSLAATATILVLFLDREDRRTPVRAPDAPPPAADRTATAVGVVAALTVVAFATTAVHGMDLALVALIGALLAASKIVSGVSLKEALKSVEWNLLLFLAATLVIGEGLLESGAAKWLVDGALALAGPSAAPSPALVVALAAGLSAAAHLVITSRTARATVLIPTLALPLAGFGVDPVALVFVTTIGSGFCQTLLVSAKPVAVFGALDEPTFDQRDLLRLAAPLLPLFVGCLIAFALWLWPAMGLSL